MSDYTKLAVWQKAHLLALDVYRETSLWPRREQFGLIAQARRAAVSIPSNLAEGRGRDSDAELSRFVSYSKGSAAELSHLLLLARDLDYPSASKRSPTGANVREVQRMLWAFGNSVRPAP